MAIKESQDYHPTDNLILRQPRARYSVSIKPSHWQIRSMIGSENGCAVYYPGGPNQQCILRLDTKTRTARSVRALGFPPGCVVVQNGWICCGGDSGCFAASYLGNLSRTVEQLDALTLAESSGSDSTATQQPVRDNFFMVTRKFGKERVNTVSLWFPQEKSPKKGAFVQPMAILSVNDNTVVFVALDKDRRPNAVETVVYPDCVNRAIISPDGLLCAAVSDDPYLYIHERAKKRPSDSRYAWVERRRILLKSQKVNDKSQLRGSFAVCFSNNGQYIAVGTQYGYISVFDTAALLQQRMYPVVADFTSSRPDDEAGAVRDMAFSPGPHDLLAWIETKGRVVIADVRRNYFSRQVIDLGQKDGVDQYTVEEPQHSRNIPFNEVVDTHDAPAAEPPAPNLRTYRMQLESQNRARRDRLQNSPRQRWMQALNMTDLTALTSPDLLDEVGTMEETDEIIRRMRVQDLVSHALPDGYAADVENAVRRLGPQNDAWNDDSVLQELFRSQPRGQPPTDGSGDESSGAAQQSTQPAASGNAAASNASTTGNGNDNGNDSSSSSNSSNGSNGNNGNNGNNSMSGIRSSITHRRSVSIRRPLEGNEPAPGRRMFFSSQANQTTASTASHTQASASRPSGTDAQTRPRRSLTPPYVARRGWNSLRSREGPTATTSTTTSTETGSSNGAGSGTANGSSSATTNTSGSGSGTTNTADSGTTNNTGSSAINSLGSGSANGTSSTSDAVPASTTNVYSATTWNTAGNVTGTGTNEAPLIASLRGYPLALAELESLYRLGPNTHDILSGLEERSVNLAAGVARLSSVMGGNYPFYNNDDMAGMSWSEDGETLFVCRVDGVYELHVNTRSRRFFPSMTLR